VNLRQPATEHQLKTRPHWWAVLSVGIALLALVTAVSGHHDLHNQVYLARTPHSQRTTHELMTGTSVHTLDPTGPNSIGTVLPTTLAPSGDPGTQVANAGPGDNSDRSATTSPSSAIAAGSVASSFEGFFESPWVVSTIYPVSSDEGDLAVTANWTQTVAMTLTLSCPPSSQSKTGGSGISLELSGFDTQCVISLSEPVDTPGVVDYTIAITT